MVGRITSKRIEERYIVLLPGYEAWLQEAQEIMARERKGEEASEAQYHDICGAMAKLILYDGSDLKMPSSGEPHVEPEYDLASAIGSLSIDESSSCEVDVNKAIVRAYELCVRWIEVSTGCSKDFADRVMQSTLKKRVQDVWG